MGAALLWERRGRGGGVARVAGRDGRGDGRMVVRAAGPVPGLAAVAALGWCWSAVWSAALGPAARGAARAGRLALGARSALGLAAALAGPVAYTLTTVNTAHTGSIVTAGPAVRGRHGRPGGGSRRRPAARRGGGSSGGTARAAAGSGQGQPGQPGRPGGPRAAARHGSGNGQAGNGQDRHGNGQAPGPAARATASSQGTGRPGFPGGTGEPGDGGAWAAVAAWAVCSTAPGQRQGQGAAGEGRGRLHLGRRGHRLPERRELPTRHREAGDGDRRLQRQRPVPDPRPVQGVRGGREDPLLHRAAGRAAAWAAAAAARSSKITSWVEDNFKKVTVGSATFYDLTRKA